MQVEDMQAEQEQKWQKMVTGQEKIRDAGRQEDASSGVIPDTDRKRRLLQCGMILFNNFLLTGTATKLP